MDSNDWISHEPGDRNILGGDGTPTPVGEGPGEGEQSRRTALERFNAELAVLDRPLEDDIEYYDDPPPVSRWRRAGATLGLFMMLGGVTSFAVARWSSPAIANEADPSTPVAVATTAPVTVPPGTAAPEPATPGTPAPAPAAAAVAARAPRHHHHHHHHHHYAFRR